MKFHNQQKSSNRKPAQLINLEVTDNDFYCRDNIEEHIESFNPETSHYRREHAPRRRYLPSDLSVVAMYENFCAKHPDNICSYNTYWQSVKQKNISFTKLGSEQCEVCEEFYANLALHDHEPEESTDDPEGDETERLTSKQNKESESCDRCQVWRQHKTRADRARLQYKHDAQQDLKQNTSVRSVDLQKVIMLPRMPAFKTTLFTKRIIAYHETFATVGTRNKAASKKKNIAITWHEGTAGRKAEEVTAAFEKALAQERDAEHVIYWLDNCSGQNKNWTLFTALITLLNTNAVTQTDVTLRYFEPGHTFMSADSVHHGVEKEMKNQHSENVYDFEDFRRVLEKSNSGQMEVIELQVSDFRNWIGQQSTKQLREKDRPRLAGLEEIQFRRGSRLMFYKHHTEDEFREFDFLKKTYRIALPGLLRQRPKGILKSKKNDIVKKLCPLMPINRRKFWQELAETTEEPNDSYQDGDD